MFSSIRGSPGSSFSRSFVFGDGFVELAEMDQRHAEIDMRGHIVGSSFRSSPISLGRAREIARLLQLNGTPHQIHPFRSVPSNDEAEAKASTSSRTKLARVLRMRPRNSDVVIREFEVRSRQFDLRHVARHAIGLRHFADSCLRLAAPMAGLAFAVVRRSASD